MYDVCVYIVCVCVCVCLYFIHDWRFSSMCIDVVCVQYLIHDG